MWVKRTESEIAEERQRQRRRHSRNALLAGALLMVMVTCTFGWAQGGHGGRFLVPPAKYSSRLPTAVVAGIVAALAFYKWERDRPMMICPKCEVTKYQDDVRECSCGGHFEIMENMKYEA